MLLIYEILPVFLFFMAFKFYGIYVATVVGIVSTFIQVLATRCWSKKWDKKQLITLSVFLFFGGLTLYLHDPIFIKWKPTVIFWIFSILLIGSQLFTPKPLMQRLMETALEGKGDVPLRVWKELNIAWSIFFIGLGAFNLYIAYYFSNDAWVNFKFYGITSALFIFTVLQTLYLARYMTETKH